MTAKALSPIQDQNPSKQAEASWASKLKNVFFNFAQPVGDKTQQQLTSDKVGDLTASVFKEKEKNKAASITGAKNKILDRYNIFLIGNDIFSLGYLAIQALGLLIPSLGAAKPMISICSVCGVIAGIFMLPIGICDLRAGLLKIRNGGEGPYGWILTLTGISEIAISAVLLLASISAACVAFGVGGAGMAAIAAFFTANPWLLALLLFIPSIFSLYEICRKLHYARTGQDPYGQLQLKSLKTNITEYQKLLSPTTEKIQPLVNKKEEIKQNLVKSIATFLNTFYGINIPKENQMADDILNELSDLVKRKLIEEEIEKEIKEHEATLEEIIRQLQKPVSKERRENLSQLKAKVDLDVAIIKEKEDGTKYLLLVFKNGTSINQEVTQRYFSEKYQIKIEKGAKYYEYLYKKHEPEYDKLKQEDKDSLLAKFVSQRVEDLTEGMGLDGAINTGNMVKPLIQLLTMIEDNKSDLEIKAFITMNNPCLNGKTLLGQVEELQKNKKVWIGVLVSRLVIQLLYVLGFAASMGTLALPTSGGKPTPADISTAIQDILLCGPQAISLVLDIVFPFIRGLPVVSDPVKIKDPKEEVVTINNGTVDFLANIKRIYERIKSLIQSKEKEVTIETLEQEGIELSNAVLDAFKIQVAKEQEEEQRRKGALPSVIVSSSPLKDANVVNVQTAASQ